MISLREFTVKSGDMAISKAELRDLLIIYREENWRGIQTPECQRQIVQDLLEEPGVPRTFVQIAAHWKPRPGMKILDIGSGVGGFVVLCRKLGLQAFGVEPDRIGRGSQVTSVEIARRRLDQSPFAVAVGEQLPFPDDTFDLVVLNNVIEHVANQGAVLREALRVAKGDGVVYVACPNYLRWYEPHYKLRWLPLMPKVLGRCYLRARGRDPGMLGRLHYTTNQRVRRLLRTFEPRQIVDLNREEFLRKWTEGAFVSKRAKFVRASTKVPLLGQFILRVALLYLRLCEGATQFLVLPRKWSVHQTPC
jgi:SAM-dependent methyltransferase